MAKKPIDKRVFDVHRTLPKPYAPGLGGLPLPAQPKKPLWKRLVISALLLFLAFLIFVGAWDGVNISRASTKIFGSGNLFNLTIGSDLKKSEQGRVNLLIVGYSVDDPGHPGASLTDSIMLLSLNPANSSGYMLSIPRDLYVKIPGYGYGKINQAYQDGGMDLLKRIVSTNFGVPIHYYALENYGAVRDTVNALGGITLNIQSPDPRGLYDPNISPVDGGPLKLANGWQKLDGQTALNLTRARGDAYGSYGFAQADFDRSEHQRQVLIAIKKQVSWTLILNPLKNGKIFQAVASNVKTDISASEARPLFGLFNRIPVDKLQSVSLRDLNGKNYLASYSSGSAGSALIPAAGINDYSQIQAALQQLN